MWECVHTVYIVYYTERGVYIASLAEAIVSFFGWTALLG